jgi:O-methyltransferase domain
MGTNQTDSSVPVSAITPKVGQYFSEVEDGTLSADKSAYEFTFGKPMYDILRENKDHKEDFDSYMAARKQEKKRLWHHCYPVMSELSKTGGQPDVTIVDVGGNRGHDLQSFAESNPDFKGRLVLQDLPETIQPLNGEQRVFEAQSHDFFTPQPIKGARLYLLLACLHNWGDDASRTILKNLADAMQKGYSRLLISGMLLLDIGAERRQAELDMQMWMLQLTRQRTKSEVEELLSSVGLELVKIWDNGDRESIVEVQLS